MRKSLLFLGLLCWAWLTGCAAAQQPVRPARVTVLQEGRDYQGFSAAEWLRLKCHQQMPTPHPRKVSYGKRRWIIL